MSSHNIVRIALTPQMVSEAEGLAEDLGILRNSITKGDGNLAGFLGEVAVAKHFEGRGIPVEHNNTYDYDLTIGKKRITIDVKTKRCTSKPFPYYECSVANFNATQKCDRYVFARVTAREVYLLGWITKEDFKEKAVFHKKGETDTNIVGGKPFKFHADCWNIRIDQLISFK